MSIDVKNIEISYGAEEILKNVSLNCNSQEFIGIIGPNGSGKSTLLKCIYRILKPSYGCVYIDGVPLESISIRDSAKKIAVVSQHNDYSFEFTVRDIVLMGRSPHKRTMERDNLNDYRIVEEALDVVNMKSYANRNFSTLSGGERQRVILARALAQNTPYLILDEPTNHLDISHQLQMLKTIKGLNKIVISAIHDLNIAAMFCDRIYALSDGKIVGEGKPEEILTSNFIFKIYNVESEIIKDSKGQMHILYT
ncbi:MAG: ABC transporter ATP-binding protein [Clostridioides difficile]|nr:ABC transporter ATP-binding protein [Clostridioides sp.]MBS5788532.1 ABC transporter ATP-binding protein [Clostridioides difficile]